MANSLTTMMHTCDKTILKLVVVNVLFENLKWMLLK